MESDLLSTIAGSYKGNVSGTFLNLGQLAKTGCIYIAYTGINNLTISSSSLLKKELSTTFPVDELKPFFNEKKKTVMLEDKKIEEQVAFERNIDDDYGFFNKWLSGLTATRYAYQLKFHNGNLVSFRVQEYNTGNPSKLTHFLEISNIERIIESTADEEPKKKLPPAKKTDWDF